MLGIPARYLLKHPWVGVEQLADPLQIWTYLQDAYFDSLHSERSALGPNRAIVVDDIDTNRGFRSFTQAFSGYQSLI